MRAGAALWLCAAAVFLLGHAPAQAEAGRLICRFPERAGSLIMPEIVLSYDRAADRITVEDKLILKLDGRPKQASLEELRSNRVVIRMIFTWRVDNIPVTTARWGYMNFNLRVEPDGRAFIETTPAYSGVGFKIQSARGRCS